ncbi:hypothetical protein ABB26_11485 [Stenotrophomonas humi]|uniref:Uncharacterized protein n=1 Tax=Stenotrophomonas humi TaxID=405444 RepID=A0A0R0CA56_9GAMM|nr:hypothetical protein [Stenotrophomonas humi]KRG63538.1 hypothetical protein ABB26_11485 [Stenotrophomonas humi]
MTFPDIFLDRIEANGIVVGINNAADIPVGTLFTQLVKVRVEGNPGSTTATELWSIPISLRITDAIIYRKSTAVVPRGWGVGLRLEGAGMEAVTDALNGKAAAEHVHLRAPGAA